MKFITVLFLACFATSLSAKTKHNFLWVVDNSGSSQSLRKITAESFEEFNRLLKQEGSIEFKSGVTTTDFFSHQGKLVSFDGHTIVDSQAPTAVKDFGNLLSAVQDTMTSFWEQGLESSLAALEGEGNLLLEKGVPLSVIYITDENDYSCKDECFGVEPEHNETWVPHSMERYTAYFRRLAQTEYIPVSIYPMVATEDSPCTLASLGARYQDLQKALGNGFTASVCPSLLKENILKVARDVIKPRK